MNFEIKQEHDEHKGVFKIYVDGKLAGELEYLHTPDMRLYLTRTEVNPSYGGQGLGSKLFLKAVEFAREGGYKVVPQCPFTAALFERMPEHQDLLV